MIQKTDYRSGHNAHAKSEQMLTSSKRSPLKVLRKERGLYTKELARLIGYSQGYISRLENCAVRPSAELADRLALLFDTSTEEIFPDGVRPSNLGNGPLTEDQTTVLGARLSRLRFSKLYSRNELAMRAGLSLQTIKNVENGKNRLIHPRTAHLLGKALGVGMEHFEPYVGSPSAEPNSASASRGRSQYVKKIIGIRVEAGYQVAELAKEAGIGKATIFQAEAGATSYSRKTARKLASVLGVEADVLLDPKNASVLDEDLVAVEQAARKRPFCQRSFAEKLLALREEKSMTRGELARAAATTPSILKRIERAVLTEDGCEEYVCKGRASTALLIRRIAAVFNLDPLALSSHASIGELADKLIELRASWGGSVRELGRQIQVHPQHLLSYENAWSSKITYKHAKALGWFYGVEPDEIYSLTNPGEQVESWSGH